MKIIVNTANLRRGGAFQRAISFLNEIKEFSQDSFLVILNREIKTELTVTTFPENFEFIELEHSPASLRFRMKTIKMLRNLESKYNPDIVFSFVGPAYWRPQNPHLVGFGLGHLVYTDYPFVQNFPIRTKLEMFYKKMWTKFEADYYIVQTEDVKNRLAKNLKINLNKIFIVTNGIGNQFDDVIPKHKNNKIKKLLLISTYRPNKNFEIINEIIKLLKKEEKWLEFHLTLEPKDYKRLFGETNKYVVNHGPVASQKCPELYNDCDAVFIPTFLECFSASYPEAMRMKKPILTSDLSFARSICGEAAIYFNQSDPHDIISKIRELFESETQYKRLIQLGEERLKLFDNSLIRAKKYIDICKDIIKLS